MSDFRGTASVHVSRSDRSSNEKPCSVDDPRVIGELEAYVTALGEGCRPNRDALLENYPQIAEELAACLDAVELVHQVGPQFDGQGLGLT